MEKLEIILIILMILGALVSIIISGPMRKHLVSETEIRKIGLFQMPFYLKDYYKMMIETSEISKKNRFKAYYLTFTIANLSFILFGIILLFIPGSSF